MKSNHYLTSPPPFPTVIVKGFSRKVEMHIKDVLVTPLPSRQQLTFQQSVLAAMHSLGSGTLEKGGAGGHPPLLPFDRRDKRGQSALFIKVPLMPANCNNQRNSYKILIVVSYAKSQLIFKIPTEDRNKMAVCRKNK